MSFSGLKDFIKKLKDHDLLVEIEEYVNPVLEIAEITDRMSKQPYGGKALLFKNTGTDFPVLTNFLGSEARLSLALRRENIEQLGHNIDLLFQLFTEPDKNFFKKIETAYNLKRLADILPKFHSGRGHCQQVVITDPDLSILPVLQLWPGDGGRFITYPLVHTKDPLTGHRNVGMYRVQIFGKDLVAMHWHRHKTGSNHFEKYRRIGEKMPVAIALGGDPVYTYVATAPLPENLYEYILAGFIRGRPVTMVKCITQDIEVPEDADIVIEGYIDPEEEFILEGPFGDHTGFYSMPDYYPRMHITAITYRKDAVYPATVVGVPPQEDAYLAKATERIFLNFVKNTVTPEIMDWDIPVAGCGHNFTIVQIRKSYPGQGKKVINALWGAGQMMFNKVMIVVDKDVDIHNNYEDLLRYLVQNVNPETDFLFGYGPSDVLDHASEKFTYGSKLGIDATTKLPEEIEESDIAPWPLNLEDFAFLTEKFSQIKHINIYKDFPVLFVFIKKEEKVKDLIDKVLKDYTLSGIKYIVVLDDIIPYDNFHLIAWLVGSNIAPARDVIFFDNFVLVDATIKTPEIDGVSKPWPDIAKMDLDTIKRVDEKLKKMGMEYLIPSYSLNFYKRQH